MPRFFVSPDRIVGDTVTIDGDDARHISFSLRMRKGERITICDGAETEYTATLVALDGQTVTATLSDGKPSESELPYEICLYQSVPKSDKFDYIVQKATELGVTRIVPVYSARCIVQPDAKSDQKKKERLSRIAREAAMQCGRGKIPQVELPCSFAKVIASLEREKASQCFICYENESGLTLRAFLESLNGLQKGDVISFFVGPEGGYAREEIETAEALGIRSVSLGNRILRCETASGFVLSCMEYAWE